MEMPLLPRTAADKVLWPDDPTTCRWTPICTYRPAQVSACRSGQWAACLPTDVEPVCGLTRDAWYTPRAPPNERELAWPCP